MPRFNPAFFAMMQKLRERKRSEARANSAKNGKLRRRKDALNMRRVHAKDPEPIEQNPASKIRLPIGAIPFEIVRPDKHRGQRYYQALDNTPPKVKRKRPRPIMVSAMRDFMPDQITLAAEQHSPDISDQPLF